MLAEPIRPVVVGVDGTDGALRAVDLAAEEAAARLAPLIVVHARAESANPDALVEAAAGRALAEHPGIAVSTWAPVGHAADILAECSRTACLVVLGHRRDPSLPPLPAGPVTRRVVHEAACPVIVHRPVDTAREVEHPRPVLMGVDGHPQAEPVVGFAFEEASLRGAPLLALHVQPWDTPDRTAMLHEATSVWSAKYPEVPVCWTVRYGNQAVPPLVAASLDAQLLVLGSHRHDARNHLTPGLVTRAVVDLFGCPVATVPLD